MPIRPISFGEPELKKIFRTDTPVYRFWRSVRRALRTAIYFLFLFGLFFIVINFPAYYHRARYAAGQTPVVTTPAPPPTPQVTYAPEIIIPKIGVEAPVSYAVSYNDILAALKNGVVQYEGTADPGQIGNVVLLGHSSEFPWDDGHYKTIFALLDRLTVGDQIILPFGSNRYTYTVSGKKIVKANDLSVLNRTATPQLTLVSCYPVGTALNRIIINATLTSGPVGAVQQTQPFLGTSIVNAR